MTDFNQSDVSDISTALTGKTITEVVTDDSGMNWMIVFKFADGTKLVLEYDWIYEWEIVKAAQ